MFVIAGVSGNTGSVVATTLLAQGKPVRVIVRDAAKGAAWKQRGAEVAVAGLSDRAALTAALAGATGAYLLVPPDVTTPTPVQHSVDTARALGAAVKAAKVPHVVLLSSLGAQHAAGNGPIRWLHTAEAELAIAGTQLTTMRAAYFQENWGGSLGMLAQGVLPTFLPVDVKFPQVATADLGKIAATALVEGARGAKQVIDALGPRELSAADIAAALTKIVGKPIAAQQFPLEGVVPTLTQFGISAATADLFREMYEGILAGRVASEGGAARTVRGTVEVDATLAKLLQK